MQKTPPPEGFFVLPKPKPMRELLYLLECETEIWFRGYKKNGRRAKIRVQWR
jgi:hypothetical protein